MAEYFDNDTLISSGGGSVTLTLKCGYGQPVSTTVYLKNTGGASQEITNFNGDASNLELGDINTFRTKRVVVYSTVHDIRDVSPGQEVEDIHLDIIISGGGATVDTSFVKKTKGKGTLVNCTYEVIVL